MQSVTSSAKAKADNLYPHWTPFVSGLIDGEVLSNRKKEELNVFQVAVSCRTTLDTAVLGGLELTRVSYLWLSIV